MKIEVKFKNSLSQVRNLPALSGRVVVTMDKSDTVYNAIASKKGYYFIKELTGWAEVSDLTIVNIIEPDTGEGYDPETKPQPSGNPSLDPTSIVDAINKSSLNINATKVVYIEDGVEYPIYGIIRTVKQSLDDMQDAVNKMAKIPNIPQLPENATGDEVLVTKQNEDGSISLVWKVLDYGQLANSPEKNELSTNEF